MRAIKMTCQKVGPLAVAVFAVLYLASFSYADTYKWVDENGTLHFGDRPPRESKYKLEQQSTRGRPKTLAAQEFADEATRKNRKKWTTILDEKKPRELTTLNSLKITLVKERIYSATFNVEYEYDRPLYQKSSFGIIPVSTKRSLDDDLRDLGSSFRLSSPIPFKSGINKLQFKAGSDKCFNCYKTNPKKYEPRRTKWLKVFICFYKGKVCEPVYQRYIPFSKVWQRG